MMRRFVCVEPKQSQKQNQTEDEVNAQFLMQATFGPTRSDLSELAGITHEVLVHRQMRLPVYYRQRVNPLSVSKDELRGVRAMCDRDGPVCLHACRCHESVRVVASRSIFAVQCSEGTSNWGSCTRAKMVLADNCLTCCRCRWKVIRVENPALWHTAGRLLKLWFNFVTYGAALQQYFRA